MGYIDLVCDLLRPVHFVLDPLLTSSLRFDHDSYSFARYCGGIKDPKVRMAWREKVTICFLILLSSCALLFLLIGYPRSSVLTSRFGPIICPKLPVWSVAEIQDMSDEKNPIVFAYGRVYQIAPLVASHGTAYGSGRGTLTSRNSQVYLSKLARTRCFLSIL